MLDIAHKKVKLKEVCEIVSGFGVRGALPFVPVGGVRVIQSKNVKAGDIQTETLERADLKGITDKFIVQNGDVVFKTRFEPNIAAQIWDIEEETVLLSPLLKLIAKPKYLAPAYLAWYINQPKAQQFFKSHSTGTTIAMVTKGTLESLPVILPTLEHQNRIATIAKLAVKEEEICLKLVKKRKRLVNFVLQQQVQKTQHS